MKKPLLTVLTAATFLMALLMPDWKVQLLAQAGGCSPHSWLYGGCDAYPLDGSYKGSAVKDSQHVQ